MPRKCDRCGIPVERELGDRICVNCEAATTCKHFKDHPPLGTMPNDWQCAAGVCLVQLCAPRFGFVTRLPCRFVKGNEPVACDKFEPITVEQVEAEDAELGEQMRKASLAIPLLISIRSRFKRGQGGNGSDPCPVCGGTIKWSCASINHHVWATCSTDNCIRIME